MARLYAMHLTEAELNGLLQLLNTVRNDARKTAYATHSQYYQSVLMGNMLDGLTMRISARLNKIHEKGTQ